MAIQRFLIRFLLDPLAKLMMPIPRKVKDLGFIAFFLCIILLYFGRGSGILCFRYIIFYGLGCLSLGGMILCTLPDHCKPVTFRKPLLIPWFGIGGLMLLSGILYNRSSLPEAMLFLTAYPLIFMVWSQRKSADIFKLLLWGMELSFWLYTLVCLLFYPINTVRYSGIFTNVNGTAGYLALAAVCLLADCLWFEKITVRRIRKLIALGTCVALLLYTGSRTGMLEFVAALLVATVIGFLRLRKQRKVFFLRNLLLVAAAAFLFFNTTMYALQFGYNAKTDIVTFVQDIFTPKPDSSPSPTGPSVTPSVPAPSQPVIRPNDSADLIGNRLDTNGMSASQISSGRLQIWSGYLKQLNLLGHRDSGTVTFRYDGSDRVYHTTHMTILQVAYENGILASICYLIFNLTAGVYSLIHALRHKGDPYAMIPLMITVAYAVYSLLASTGVSFWYLGTLVYYLAQFPIMTKPQPTAALEEKQVDA